MLFRSFTEHVMPMIPSGKTVREVAKEQKVLSDKRLTELLDPWRMTMPGGPVGSAGG